MNKKNNILFPLKVMFTTKPLYLVMLLVMGILHSFANVFNVIVAKEFFDKITNIRDYNNLTPVWIWMVLYGGVIIVELIINGIHNFMFSHYSLIINGELDNIIFNKIARVEPILFEDTNTLNSIEKAEQGAQSIFNIYITIFTILTFYLPYFLLIGLYLYFLQPALAILLIIIFLPVVTTQIFKYTIYSKLIDKTAQIKREFEYYDSCISDRNYFKETRFLNISKYFKKLFINSIEKYSCETWRANLKIFLVQMVMKVFTILGYCGVLVLLIKLLIAKNITIGTLAAVFSSINTMYSAMDELISRHIGSVLESYGTAKKFLLFLNLEETTRKHSNIIQAQNLIFRYPNTNNDVLKNINFTIDKNETVALVGLNGSGKSTLAKHIASIYCPLSGKITTMNNKYISMVFQNFNRYKLSLKDNIIISDYMKVFRDNNFYDTAHNAGISSKFIEKYKNIILSKDFEGTDLSGGEWQRIAIARGIYKEHQLIILDEPTASINPLEETRLFNEFAKVCQNKTALLITHRLGSVKIADKIIVLKNGEIEEVGSFQDLLNSKGYFYQLYSEQAQWYKE